MTSSRLDVPASPEEVRSRLAGLDRPPPRDEGVAWGPYREAAAVLASFDLGTLRPAHGAVEPKGPPLDFILECERELGGPRWRLRTDIRRATLSALIGSKGIQRARAANSGDSNDPAQRWLDRALAGVLTRETPVPRGELLAVSEVLTWLDGLVDGLPDRGVVRGRIALEDLLRPLRRLVGDHFRGRRAELAKLRSYVGVIAPDGGRGPITFDAQPVRDFTQRPPLVVFGAGGLGKSTLLAQFVLEHVERATAERFSFAYFNFDRPDLTIEQPMLLLAEMVRQLGFQYPSQRTQLDALRREISTERVQGAGGLESLGTRRISVGGLLSALRVIDAHDRPFLVMFDTFEEVQYASGAYLASLWEFLEVLQDAVPLMRVVFAGRGPIEGFPTERYPLGELDPEAAVGYLQARGLRDEETARLVAERLGGNPLSLSLAAEVVAREGPGGWDRRALPLAREAQVQGMLYERILKHIHDDDVRRLAHPGLVLRLVTPEIIREVLAVPCGLAVPSHARAQEIFKLLARESSLVEREGDALRHRADVRRLMLESLQDDEPDRVAEIQRRAIAYHAGRPGVVDRAEEIYHRLRLGADPSEIYARWIPEVRGYLRGAIEEIPTRQRAALVSLLGIDLDARTRAEADLLDWERDTKKRVSERLFVGRAGALEEALAMLRERNERSPRSALPLLEVEVLQRLERFDDARTAVETARPYVRARGRAETARLLLRAGEIARELKRHDEAFETLEQAAQHARAAGDDVLAVECRLLQHSLLTEQGRDETRRELEAQLANLATEVRDRLPPQHRRRVEQIAESSRQLDMLSPALVAELRRAISSAVRNAGDLEWLVVNVLRDPLRAIAWSGSLATVIQDVIIWSQRMGRTADLVRGMLDHYPNNPQLRAVASKLRLIDTAHAPDAGCLDDRLGADVRAAAVSAGLQSARDALMTGIEPSVAPSAVHPLQQMMHDIRELDARAARGDTAPFRSWLAQAIALAGPRREANVFRRADDALLACDRASSDIRTEGRVGIDLKGKQIEAFRDALLSAYPKWSDLEAMALFELNESLGAIVSPGPMKVVVLNLINWARQYSTVDKLLRAALAQNKTNQDLLRFAYEVTLTSDAPPEGRLESIVVKNVPFPDAATWRARMERAEHCVARIEYQSSGGWRGIGTGFLVGPDLLLTNYHVLRDLEAFSTPWRANFDYAVNEDGDLQGGRASLVVGSTAVRASGIEALDYALLRLEDRPADDKLDGTGVRRGVLALTTHSIAQNEPLFILQHPNAERLKVGVGVVTRTSVAPPRVWYSANTLPGSSGAPCFNLAWDLVAIHHAGQTTQNRGIPLSAVVADLQGHVSLGTA